MNLSIHENWKGVRENNLTFWKKVWKYHVSDGPPVILMYFLNILTGTLTKIRIHTSGFSDGFLDMLFFLEWFNFLICSMQENSQNVVWLLLVFWADVSLFQAWKSSSCTGSCWLDKCRLWNLRHEKAHKAGTSAFPSELPGSAKGFISASAAEAKS